MLKLVVICAWIFSEYVIFENKSKMWICRERVHKNPSKTMSILQFLGA